MMSVGLIFVEIPVKVRCVSPQTHVAPLSVSHKNKKECKYILPHAWDLSPEGSYMGLEQEGQKRESVCLTACAEIAPSKMCVTDHPPSTIASSPPPPPALLHRHLIATVPPCRSAPMATRPCSSCLTDLDRASPLQRPLKTVDFCASP